MTGRLYIVFWELSLANLPQGRFEHRKIDAAEASAMIRAARTDNAVAGISRDDLFAPFATNKRRRHEELCAVLAEHYDCPVRLADFTITFEHRGAAVQSVAPLEVAQLQSEDRLMVVSCNYESARSEGPRRGIEDLFVPAPDSVTFHLIEHL